MLPVLRRTLRWALKVLRHNKRVFVLTFTQRSAQHSLTALSDELAKLNPRVAFAQTYPDEIQGAFDRASDALHAALMAARDNGFWVGIGIGELNIPRFAGALGAVSTTDCTGDALEFSRLAIEEAQGGAPSAASASAQTTTTSPSWPPVPHACSTASAPTAPTPSGAS